MVQERKEATVLPSSGSFSKLSCERSGLAACYKVWCLCRYARRLGPAGDRANTCVRQVFSAVWGCLMATLVWSWAFLKQWARLVGPWAAPQAWLLLVPPWGHKDSNFLLGQLTAWLQVGLWALPTGIAGKSAPLAALYSQQRKVAELNNH